MTVKEMQRHLATMLQPSVGADEAKAMASDIIEEIKGYTALDVVLYGHRPLLFETEERMLGVAKKVIDGMPLQYVLGTAHFHGRKFKVSSDTLIPRPETSQLVDLIETDWIGHDDLKILDVGTGSGCIAISLSLDLPFSQVTGIDISPKALETAIENAQRLGAKTKFQLGDAINLDIIDKQWDIIVSNPPYVLESERSEMDDRVTRYEPSLALFVPDNDPLKFYLPIAEYAYRHLSDGGKLYFEINPLCAKQLKDALRKIGFDDVDVIRDYKGNYRFATAIK